jgi:hypothetical protein
MEAIIKAKAAVAAITGNLKPRNKNKKDDTPVNRKAKNLLALRTIISMLSLIHSSSGRSSNDKAPMGGKVDRKQLKVLDALSALFIRRYEITAVVASPPNNASNLQVFTSVSNPSDAELSESLQPDSNSENQPEGRGLWTQFCNNFIVSVNPRSDSDGNADSLMNMQKWPLITDCKDKVPLDLVTASELEAVASKPLLALYLEKFW